MMNPRGARLAVLLCAIVLQVMALQMMVLQAQAGEVKVAVAANFATPMKELAAEFERASGHQLKLAFGSSGKFYAQISNGAPFGVFLSADQAKPLALEKNGLAVPGSRFTYALGALALWSAQAGREVNENVLREQRFNKLALANPRLAPYGEAAVTVLENLNLKEATRAKWVQGENIAQAFQFIDTGNAQLGFVALSQIMEAGKVVRGSAWIIPERLHPPIRQDAVLLKVAEQNGAARELLRFMRSPRARTIMESHGYRTDT